MTEFNAQAGPAERAMPERVFHCTSLETMTRIVDSRALWCTAIRYLNDIKVRTVSSTMIPDVKMVIPNQNGPGKSSSEEANQ
jgi:hypothetical protein